ncbi:MAG: tRNA (adenosine(37)-N6)-threonylcarbamoyltransferase complex dimerization subunit type 1 TsaB [Micavibrio sp.]
MTHILAFDTAMNGCSVAVLDTATDQAISETKMMVRGQSELLVPMVDDIVAKAGITFQDLDLIVTTIGPGAFTGLRIGLSAARSFALALDIPLAGVTTTEVLAQKFFNDHKGKGGDLLVLIETKRTDLYFQPFDESIKARADAGVMSATGLRDRFGDQMMFVCGDGATRCKAELGTAWPETWSMVEGYDLPDAVVMAQLGAELQKIGLLKPPVPLYLRDADVSVSTRPGRVIAAIQE